MTSDLADWQKEIVEYYKKQEGRPYPISNQVVVCGFCTNDLKKWKSFKKEQKDHIVEEREFSIRLDNGERWTFINPWSNSIRGYRFYKIFVDRNIKRRIVEWYLLPSCAIYCKSFEWL